MSRSSELDVRDKRLMVVQHATHVDYLRSEDWGARRATWIADHPNATCVVCGREQVELHHITYAHIGMERDEELVPLCAQHHEEVHVLAGPRLTLLRDAHIRLIRDPQAAAKVLTLQKT